MKTLLLLRHAKSSWDAPAPRDFDRPLAPRGERDAPKIGKALRESGVAVELVVSSPAARARQTAELVTAAAKLKAPLHFDDAIYEAGVSALLGVVRGLPEDVDTAMLVGHNPGFEDLLGTLVGDADGAARVRVPTAMLACVELESPRWRDVTAGAGTLVWMVVPRLLG
jgi:phosphohistidine phosphatase